MERAGIDFRKLPCIESDPSMGPPTFKTGQLLSKVAHETFQQKEARNAGTVGSHPEPQPWACRSSQPGCNPGIINSLPLSYHLPPENLELEMLGLSRPTANACACFPYKRRGLR